MKINGQTSQIIASFIYGELTENRNKIYKLDVLLSVDHLEMSNRREKGSL